MYDLHIPDGLPELSRGGHPDHTQGKACIMELVSFLAGEEWGDDPATSHPILRSMAIEINDRMHDNYRYLLNPLISWFFGTNEEILTEPLLGYLGMNTEDDDWASSINNIACVRWSDDEPSKAECEEMVAWLEGALQVADRVLTEYTPYQITEKDIESLRFWLELDPRVSEETAR